MTLPWGITSPDLAQFVDQGAQARVIPVVRRLLADDLTPVGVYRRLAANRPGTFMLESAQGDGTWARYSFVGVSSRAMLTTQAGQACWVGDLPAGLAQSGDMFELLRAGLATLHTPPIAGLPPLTGGLVGILGWDVVRQWEPTLPKRAPVEIAIPDIALLLVSDLVVLDHVDGSVWLIANAINFDNTSARITAAYEDACARLDAMETGLSVPISAQLSQLDTTQELPELQERVGQEAFVEMVNAGKEAIAAGDVFQVVLSGRIDVACPADPFDVYRVLRTVNPSPYMYFFSFATPEGGSFAVVGSSPETLVRVQGSSVLTFPIAGSRPRGVDAEDDARLEKELLHDPKERAEHVMLVDLARNDLAKVCEPGSVEVLEFMKVHRFSHISHITSTVTGRLDQGHDAVDTFQATFPAGTLSGAPKNRAIEIIDELEVARRGLYGGTVGYFDFAGNMDMAIAIRTAVIRDGIASVQAGAGIVADSQPVTEYAESRTKAAAALRAVHIASQLRSTALPLHSTPHSLQPKENHE